MPHLRLLQAGRRPGTREPALRLRVALTPMLSARTAQVFLRCAVLSARPRRCHMHEQVAGDQGDGRCMSMRMVITRGGWPGVTRTAGRKNAYRVPLSAG